jgi:hypothetical protein
MKYKGCHRESSECQELIYCSRYSGTASDLIHASCVKTSRTRQPWFFKVLTPGFRKMRCKKLRLFKDMMHTIMNRFLVTEKAEQITKSYFQNLNYQCNSGLIPVNDQNGWKSYRKFVEFFHILPNILCECQNIIVWILLWFRGCNQNSLLHPASSDNKHSRSTGTKEYPSSDHSIATGFILPWLALLVWTAERSVTNLGILFPAAPQQPCSNSLGST